MSLNHILVHPPVQTTPNAPAVTPGADMGEDQWMQLLTGTMGSTGNLKELSKTLGIDLSGRYPAAMIMRNILGPLGMIAFMRASQQAQLQPQLNQIVSQRFNSLLNPEERVASANSKIDAETKSTTQQVLNRLKTMGAGIGTVGGAIQSGANKATEAKNQNRAYEFSGAGMNDTTHALFQLLGMNSPDLGSLMGINQSMVGTPHGKSGFETMMDVGNMIGQFMPGGGGGGGAAPYSSQVSAPGGYGGVNYQNPGSINYDPNSNPYDTGGF